MRLDEIEKLSKEEKADYLRHNYIMRTVPDKIKHDKKYKGTWKEQVARAFGYEDVKDFSKVVSNGRRSAKRRKKV